MRVLWIVNQPIAYLRTMLNMPLGQSGGWMETAYQSIKASKRVTLGVAAIYMGTELKQAVNEGHKFFAVPFPKLMRKYNPDDRYNQQQWEHVIALFKPDVIHIWGTEYPTSLCVLKAAKEIPSVVYIQGMMNQIAKHCLDGICLKEQIRNTTLFDIKNSSVLWNMKKNYNVVAQREATILKTSGNVIVESDWCACNCLAVNPNSHIFRSKLPVSKVFFDYEWDYEKIEPHTIFTVAGGYPIKGHHVLMNALVMVKKVIPDVKLYIPGTSGILSNDMIGKLRMSSYDKYIKHIIDKYHIAENIILKGRLTPEQMAEQLSKSHIFVMPSSCETHCSSLIEAMVVGTPTISSYVGGISQYYKDGENGRFYRFDEPEVLASLIIDYFKDKDRMMKIANAGKVFERKSRSEIDIMDDFEKIYFSIINSATSRS